MQMNLKSNKAGVSLITVLLLMLVATIAATATWKWITSEGFSSASRMLKREAYQSSVAGIENAHAWMTFHANDVGSLVKQYLDGGNEPINIDAQLRPLLRSGQNHHVWLTGVNTENTTYKLKFLSIGEARNGTSHSEVAIFNVDGLYRVQLPAQKVAKKTTFDYAYFGGSYNGAGDLQITSAVVNGNWSGNPQTVSKKFVVTGNANLSGNNVNIGELACVGGNLSPENNGLMVKDLFVNGNFDGNIDATGNAYFNGDVSPSSGGEFSVDGNTTLNGILKTVQSAKNMTLSGNLCLDENARIVSQGNNYTFTAGKNVWMPGKQNIWYGSVQYSGCTCKRKWCSYMGYCMDLPNVSCSGSSEKYEMIPYWGGGTSTYTLIGCSDTTYKSGGDNYGSYEKIILGNDASAEVHMRSGHSWDQYDAHRTSTMVTETNGRVARCNTEPGVMNPVGHAYCQAGQEEKWKGDDYFPYPERVEKENLYYSFYYEGTGKEVEFKDFVEEYWYWCNEWKNFHHGPVMGGGFKYCDDYTEGVTYGAYFVDGKRYWDGYDPEASHPHQRLNHNGTTPTGSPYCTDSQDKTGRKKYRVSCGVTPWFKSLAKVTNSMGTREFECAEGVVEQCDEIWEKKPGCDGSSYKVDDILVTARSKFEPYASKGCAANITTYSKDLVTQLNACYSENTVTTEKAEQNLYNGYLVVKVSGGTTSTNPTGTLVGKFIIIAEDALYTKLPPTGENTYVMLYLEKGANTLNDATVSNYFIYTEGDIGSGNQFNLTGSIYATAESCAGIGKLQSSSVTYNSTLVQQLTDAGVICDNDGGVCGGTSTTSDPATGTGGEGSSTTEESSAESGLDAYYISMAPQLRVSIETQYKNDEPEPSNDNPALVDSSYIILPRVIYLPSDPYGELKDYYNVIPLNGSHLKKTDVSVSSCAGSAGTLPISGKLYDGTTTLSKGIYKCISSAANYSDIPFWVVVGNAARGSSPVTFEEPWQEIGSTGSVSVNAIIPPHSNTYTLNVECKDDPAGDTWTYSLTSLVPSSRDASSETCSFEIVANDAGMLLQLFTVNTDEATSGSVKFRLLPSEDYIIGSPYETEVMLASSAFLERADVTADDISTFCSDNPGVCPPVGERDNDSWPNCYTSDTWVEPSGVAFGVEEKNQKWRVVLGGSGVVKLVAKNVGDCIPIIPNEGKDLGTFTADKTETLRASLKSKKHTLTVSFVGDMGETTPVITIEISNGTSSRTSSCTYSTDQTSCLVNVYSGETVSLVVDKDTYTANSGFSYWLCSGTSCPTSETITDDTYSLTVNDDNTTVYAHFNEKDKHCFFEEFKTGKVSCEENKVEYCIDACGSAEDSKCVGVVDANNSYESSKWHLISGSMGSIDGSAFDHVAITANKQKTSPVVILSTVNAGVYGTLKALFQPPRVTTSYNYSSDNIAKSGFLLHSNATGTEYLMLNMFINQSGYLESRICTNTGSCLNGMAVNQYSSPISATSSDMVMMSATLTTDGELVIKAYNAINYYGSQTEYSLTFDLNSLSTQYKDLAHEYTGFSLADPGFRLYGIGWKSDTYSSECHQTFPTVKCSFAAVANNGVIPLGKSVKPWIGHSGWFSSAECTESFYYYNGSDACGGSSGDVAATCSEGYTFAKSGAGQHGYQDASKKDVKTAKAWLSCTSADPKVTAWATETESERAHCGPFWTGAINECSEHVILSDATGELVANKEKTVTFDPVNLRATTLTIVLANAVGYEIEVWLVSQNEKWGEAGYASKSVIITDGQGSFDVDAEMVVGADGFDPENVTQIVLKNRSDATNVSVTSVIASCKKAVDINSCEAVYNDEDGKWGIVVDVVNKDNISAYAIDAKVNGVTEFSITGVDPVWTTDATPKASFEKADNPYSKHQGQSYEFTATIVNKTGSTASKECSVSPNPIGAVTTTCSLADNVTSVQQGQGLPQFVVNFANCPHDGCPYEIFLEGTLQSDLSGTASAGSSTINKTATGNTETLYFSAGTYKYTVRSTEGSEAPFPECESSFTVTEASGPDVGLETVCSFEGTDIQPGSNTTFEAYIGSNVSDRDYELRDANNNVVKEGKTGTNPRLRFTINGTNTISSQTFTFYVKDGDEFKQSCSATTDVGAIGLTCTNEGSFKIAVENPCANDACPYQVKKTYKGVTTILANSSGTNLGSNSYSFPFEGYGTYVLYINDKATDCSVSLSMDKPGFSCPVSTDVTVGNSVAFVLESVTGCNENDNDCSYVVDGTSSQGSGYKSGALGSFVDASVTSATTKTYTVTLTNESGPTSHNCAVKYDAGNSGGGKATCAVNKDSVMVGEQNLTLSVTGMDPAPTSEVKIPMVCGDKTLTTPTCRTSGSCDVVNFTAPSTPGKYICSFEVDGFNPCKTLPTFIVAQPVSCSISAELVSTGTQITFSGTANTKWGAQASSCGFKINGNWLNNDQNQNFTSRTMTYTVNSQTTFSVVCTQGQAPEATRVCSKTVTVY